MITVEYIFLRNQLQLLLFLLFRVENMRLIRMLEFLEGTGKFQSLDSEAFEYFDQWKDSLCIYILFEAYKFFLRTLLS